MEYEVVHSKSPVFYDTFDRKSELKGQTHYCPGCGHGVAHKLIAEALADLGLQDRTIFISPVGCSVFAYYYFDVGNVQASHGRTPAVATGVKRAHPDSIVIAYQGDGDLAAIGTAEIVHAANRGENISAFFVNNAIYGMTGGQMAPTTLVGQTSSTSPWGRRPTNEGFPIRVSEMLATIEAPVYIERVALCDNKNIMRARRAIRRAIENQRDGLGFSLVEILSPCPTIWNMDPVKARQWVGDAMVKTFPLGVFRDRKPEMPVIQVPQRSVAEVLDIRSHENLPSGQPQAHAREITVKAAGFGGQGVLLLGQMLAEMGMDLGMEVSWLPSYGPEMRSGSCHCHVCLSRTRIGSPLVSHPDVLIALNEISLTKFAASVAPKGLVLYNGRKLPVGFDRPAHLRVVCVPASEIADQIGSAKVANVVMLGALLSETECLPAHAAITFLERKVKNSKLLELDKQALEAGRKFDEHEIHEPISQPDGFAGED
ncbi:MAG: 2-oxoacid:acceptor oxidoreductase family protein [Acidobacteria bacterium]|nr:2-oxoacid:acceptor oxidoreductase family protein [Acidobacteriota bacterium]